MSMSNLRAGWVGRSIRRLEDPALVTGRGRFSGDLGAAHWLRFVRSPVAAGRIDRLTGPPHALVVTAADLVDVKPIRPMLHAFEYRPVDQTVLASEVVRFVGEPIAAVVAASAAAAEDLADRVEVEIAPTPAVIDARDALAAGAPRVHSGVAENVLVNAFIETPGFDHERDRKSTRLNSSH